MEKLVLHLLGSFQANLGERPLPPFRTIKAQALLIYLAVENAKDPGKVQQGEALMELLWPGLPLKSAQVNLRQTIYQLRKMIPDNQDWTEGEGTPFLLTQRRTIQVNPDFPIELDVAKFSSLLAGHPGIEEMETAVSLYRGDFLTDFFLPDSAVFEEWAASHRAAYRRQALEALDRMTAKCLEQNKYEEAQTCARRQLEIDDLKETAVCQLLTALAKTGARSQALVEYEQFQQRLCREFGVDPSQETQELFQKLWNDELPPFQAGFEQPASIRGTPATDTAVTLPAFLKENNGDTSIARPVFVAREMELSRLKTALDQVVDGRGQINFVVGGAGRGKSSLMQAFAIQAQQTHPDLVVASGFCNDFSGVGDPYLPFRQVLAILTGDVEAKWRAGHIDGEQTRRLWQLFPETMQTLLAAGPDLIDSLVKSQSLISRAMTAVPANSDWLIRLQKMVEIRAASLIVPDIEKTNLFSQYARVLQQLSQQAPLLILLDDLQWADSASIGLLFHLGRVVGNGRILVLGAYRPEEVALGREGERHPLAGVVHELQRLHGDVLLDLAQQNPAADRAFVDAFLDSEPNRLDEAFRQALTGHTGGHALFVVELVHTMQERGDLFQDEAGRWQAAADLTWEALPTRLEAVIAERIGRLPEELHQLLSAASVEGELFTAQVVARVQNMPERQLLHDLSQELDKQHRLVHERGEIQAGKQSLSLYRFVHKLFQIYLYHELSPGERRLLHGEIAAALEEYHVPAIDDIAVQLAFHYYQAGLFEKAKYYFTQAGRQAQERYAHEEAAHFYSQALALMTSNDPDRFDLLTTRMTVYDKLAWRDQQKADVEAMLSLAKSQDNDTWHCDALLALVDFQLTTRPQQAREPAIEAAAIAGALGDAKREGQALRRLGEYDKRMGDFARSLAELETAADRFREADMLVELAKCLDTLAFIHSNAFGEYEVALTLATEAVALSRQIGDKMMEVDCLYRLIGVCFSQGQLEKATAIADEALALAQQTNYRRGESGIYALLAVCHHMLGNHETAVAYQWQNLRLAHAIGSFAAIFIAISNLWQDHFQPLGEYEAGLEFLEAQLEQAGPADEHWPAWVYYHEVCIFILFGQFDAALELVQSKLPTIEQIGDHVLHARTLVCLGWVQAELNHFQEARQQLQKGYEIMALTSPHTAFSLARLAWLGLLEGTPTSLANGLHDARNAVELCRGVRSATKYLAEALNFKALLHLALQQADEALEASEELMALVEEYMMAKMEPQAYYFTHAQVLQANGRNDEAEKYWCYAYERVMLVAKNTRDARLRRSWFENVRVNREILNAWAEHNPST